MSILRLPVELILLILRGMSLKDVLHITRACSYLRMISLNFKELWVHTFDAANLPLPLGETLDTIDATLLPRYAQREVSIQSKWEEPMITPIRSLEPTDIYALPTPCIPEGVTPLGPFCCLLPGGLLFVLGRATAVGLYHINGRFGHYFEKVGRVLAIDWMSEDNGASIYLGFLIGTGKRYTSGRSLCIYSLTQHTKKNPVVSQPKYYPLAPYTEGLSMKHSLILTWGPETTSLLMLDPVSGDAMNLLPALDEPSMKVLHADLHPSDPSTMVLLATGPQHIYRLLVVRNVAKPGVSTLKQGIPLVTELLNSVDDPGLIIHPAHHGPGFPPFAIWVENEATGVVYIDPNSTTPLWTIQHPSTPVLPSEPVYTGSQFFRACSTSTGRLFLFVMRDQQVGFFQYQRGSSLANMKTLDPIATEFVTKREDSQLQRITFDPVLGILVLVANPRVLILQY
ncbi:hypothetical protein B0H15DRAFT_803776 [Mycena belliarum]|uniref:F-box domain-containing protein n=1 Tax=Mycena belliarum TaxID=1033014 RepID=A0AAD6XQQ8_9AGAR|nr:hypothetical protein B0H15DRAFT_803776 [Mycena belliae]